MISAQLKRAVLKAPLTLGNQLGREAVRLDFSIIRVAKYTGATRPTVYAWFKGGSVTPAYRARVSGLLTILKAASTADAAWRKACRFLPSQDQ